jgi:hypothetical protein
MNRTSDRRTRVTAVTGLLFICFVAALPVAAQNDIGGHIGVVVPIVQVADGETTDITDNFVIGYPMGITVKTQGPAFDLEIVPFIDDDRVTNVLIHPGLLFGLQGGFTFGLRAAFETGGAYGFTPLLNKGFPIGRNTSMFMEIVLPIRFIKEESEFIFEESDLQLAFAGAIHVGIGF